MPGPLKEYKRDPNGKGRPAGFYYHRGKGEYSLYSPTKDRKHKAVKKTRRRKKTRNFAPRKWGKNPSEGSYIHTHDYDSTRTARAAYGPNATKRNKSLHQEWNGRNSSKKLGGAINAAKRAGNGNR